MSQGTRKPDPLRLPQTVGQDTEWDDEAPTRMFSSWEMEKIFDGALMAMPEYSGVFEQPEDARTPPDQALADDPEVSMEPFAIVPESTVEANRGPPASDRLATITAVVFGVSSALLLMWGLSSF